MSKYYVVLKGKKTGIFTNWPDCQAQVNGFKGALYKSFKTLTEAEKAFNLSAEQFKNTFHQQEQNTKIINPNLWTDDIILDSICVDASCLGNPGLVEYRGVHLATGEIIFQKKPIPNGTNNIGEFLAIVHGLAYLKTKNSTIPIYSDSKIAINWVKRQKVTTNLIETEDNQEIFDLINRALFWLENNRYQNKIIKWDTANYGQIPADFGRK